MATSGAMQPIVLIQKRAPTQQTWIQPWNIPPRSLWNGSWTGSQTTPKPSLAENLWCSTRCVGVPLGSQEKDSKDNRQGPEGDHERLPATPTCGMTQDSPCTDSHEEQKGREQLAEHAMHFHGPGNVHNPSRLRTRH